MIKKMTTETSSLNTMTTILIPRMTTAKGLAMRMIILKSPGASRRTPTESCPSSPATTRMPLTLWRATTAMSSCRSIVLYTKRRVSKKVIDFLGGHDPFQGGGRGVDSPSAIR